jgi:DNA polymerase-3 subunit chi
LEALDEALWLSQSPDWLPHGMAGGAHDDWQPILLSQAAEAVNGARFLFLVDGAEVAVEGFVRVFDLFDGNDEAAVAAARARWRAATAAGHALTYWQQGPKGWVKAAG